MNSHISSSHSKTIIKLWGGGFYCTVSVSTVSLFLFLFLLYLFSLFSFILVFLPLHFGGCLFFLFLCFLLSLSCFTLPSFSLYLYLPLTSSHPSITAKAPTLSAKAPSPVFLLLFPVPRSYPKFFIFPIGFLLLPTVPVKKVVGESVLPQDPLTVTQDWCVPDPALVSPALVRAESKRSETEASGDTLNQSRGKGWGKAGPVSPGLARGVSPNPTKLHWKKD